MRVVSDGEWICHNTWPQHGLKLPVQVVTMSGRVLLDLTEDGLWWPGDPFVITSTLTSVSHPLPPQADRDQADHPDRTRVLEKIRFAGLRHGASKLTGCCKNTYKHHSRSSRLHQMIANLIYVSFCHDFEAFLFSLLPCRGCAGLLD